MIFIIGGNSQGKLEFAKGLLGLQDGSIADGEECSFHHAFDKPVLNKLHMLIKRVLAEDIDPMEFVMAGIERNPSITVICDELGSGVVPVNQADREIQEQVGRIQCSIAKKAEKVYRVYCSLPVLIKGIENGA
ncbi:MAG: hypothetical protein GX434_10875 [Peptococcaceae bacterium]|nr:hypothetical protein [Peptococcaceae bacterium]